LGEVGQTSLSVVEVDEPFVKTGVDAVFSFSKLLVMQLDKIHINTKIRRGKCPGKFTIFHYLNIAIIIRNTAPNLRWNKLSGIARRAALT
jgi:hypothetical protein